MNRPILLRLLVPLAALLLAEIFFRAGYWESMAEPTSRIGATVTLKKALAQETEPFQLVTLGNSRAEYGLDFGLIQEMADRHGQRHARATLRGANWLTWVTLADWLKQNYPTVDNAIIAVSVADLFWTHNGSFEVRMVEPLRVGIWPRREARLIFDRNDSDSYAIWSSLLAYRADLADYVLDPATRQFVLAREPMQMPPALPVAVPNLCHMPIDSIESCAAFTPKNLLDVKAVEECQRTVPALKERQDWRPPAGAQHAAEREAVLQLRQQQIGNMPFSRPVVVLMPVLKVWREEVFPEGHEAWVRRVFEPLLASGRISLIDATGYFDSNAGGECSAFSDFYHQTPEAAHAMTAALLPQIETALYGKRVLPSQTKAAAP